MFIVLVLPIPLLCQSNLIYTHPSEQRKNICNQAKDRSFLDIFVVDTFLDGCTTDS